MARFQAWLETHVARGGAVLMTSHAALQSNALAEFELAPSGPLQVSAKSLP